LQADFFWPEHENVPAFFVSVEVSLREYQKVIILIKHLLVSEVAMAGAVRLR